MNRIFLYDQEKTEDKKSRKLRDLTRTDLIVYLILVKYYVDKIKNFPTTNELIRDIRHRYGKKYKDEKDADGRIKVEKTKIKNDTVKTSNNLLWEAMNQLKGRGLVSFSKDCKKPSSITSLEYAFKKEYMSIGPHEWFQFSKLKSDKLMFEDIQTFLENYLYNKTISTFTDESAQLLQKKINNLTYLQLKREINLLLNRIHILPDNIIRFFSYKDLKSELWERGADIQMLKQLGNKQLLEELYKFSELSADEFQAPEIIEKLNFEGITEEFEKIKKVIDNEKGAKHQKGRKRALNPNNKP